MPTRPPHPCSRPGCGALTTTRFCEAHAQAYRQDQDARRGSRHERGYDAGWVRRRADHLRREPLCRMCLAETPPVTTAATDVDHIVPRSQGGTEDDSNLQSLCHPHHQVKSWREGLGKRRRRRAALGIA